MTQPSKSLIIKLCEVMDAVTHIEKGGHNRDQNYDFARDVDVSAALRKELSSRKVFMSSSITNVETELYTTKNGGRGAIKTVYTTHKFIDGETGEELPFTWASEGMDGQDKGVSKGATSAIKYALLKQFLIPTGEDPDEGKVPDKDKPATAAAVPRTAPPAASGAKPPTQLNAPAAVAALAFQPTYGKMTPGNMTEAARRWFFGVLKGDIGVDHAEALKLLGVNGFKENMEFTELSLILNAVRDAVAAQARKVKTPDELEQEAYQEYLDAEKKAGR